MRGFIILLFISLQLHCAHAYELVWGSGVMKVLKYDAPAQSGLDAVYVAEKSEGLRLSFLCNSGNESPSQVKWYKYSTLGGAYAERIDASIDNNKSTVTLRNGDMGYMVEYGSGKYCFWLVDYRKHPLSLSSIHEIPDDSGCEHTTLLVDGVGDKIGYYGINGRKFTLSRELMLRYTSLVYDDKSGGFKENEVTEQYEYLSERIRCKAPFTSTAFCLSGDRFLKEWGREVEIASQTVLPKAVTAHLTVTQNDDSADNQIAQPSGSAFGGSAPCVIDFSAAVTDAVVFTEWQFSSTPDFEDINYRQQELNFSHTFNTEGTEYVRFVCADSSGECEYYSEIYPVTIGKSVLKCPNVFSPGNADGVNDEWRVSYSSIVSFECHIFNRYGREITSFNDPAMGWDGTYKGKLVPAGVYYYVIKAKGADGKQYELSGDINILN